jgi:hypothetical protein
MLKAVTGVVPLANYQLLLTFAGGESRVFDVAPYLAKGVFALLREKTLFDAVRISFDTIAWPNGADFCPELLYANSRVLAPDEISEMARAGTSEKLEAAQ